MRSQLSSKDIQHCPSQLPAATAYRQPSYTRPSHKHLSHCSPLGPVSISFTLTGGFRPNLSARSHLQHTPMAEDNICNSHRHGNARFGLQASGFSKQVVLLHCWQAPAGRHTACAREVSIETDCLAPAYSSYPHAHNCLFTCCAGRVLDFHSRARGHLTCHMSSSTMGTCMAALPLLCCCCCCTTSSEQVVILPVGPA